MYEKLEECPSCKHTKFSNHLICKDHTVSGESFALVKCDKCGIIITNPRPDVDSIAKYYEDKNYISHTNKANNPINIAYKLVRSITLKQKYDLIKKHNQQKRLLDFGCGSGVFLNYIKEKGYEVSGLESHAETAQSAQQLTGATIYSKLQDLHKHHYDVITAWHVIEHVHLLRDTINTLRKCLNPNGILIIAVPNHRSFDAEFYKANWAAYDVPKHLYHFDQSSIKTLAKNCKLKVKATYPMKFDSYYVSLLSEKYANGKQNLAKAIQIGYQSNKKANQTGEYSSLIYVLEA
ncbi:MAG: methyltransferase [Rickettsiales bacterium]|nr:methyltransferase [Rickettsiales bacterium]